MRINFIVVASRINIDDSNIKALVQRQHLLVFDGPVGWQQARQLHDVATAVQHLVVELDRPEYDHRRRYKGGTDQGGKRYDQDGSAG